MKGIFLKYPVTARFVLAILLGITALFMATVITGYVRIPFVDVALLVTCTWILYRTDGKSLTALGLNITLRHFSFLLLGFAIGILALGLETFIRTIYTGEHWELNSHINGASLLKTLYFILPSVIVQELMFRGYLFTKTIEVTNVVIANVIFSILFMLVHVLDRDVLQNTGQLIFLAVSIPVGHLLFATALLRSKTLYFPIGLHWGNNWASSCLIAYGSSDNAIFHISNQYTFTSWIPFIVLLMIFNVVFLLITFVIWKWDSQFFRRSLRSAMVLRK